MEVLKSSFSYLQKIGKALMLPVALLPAAGILLGVGSAHFTIIPEALSNIMAQSGGAIFGNIPLLFAIGTALGLAANDGVSALSAAVGYVVMLATMGVFAKFLGSPVTPVMGIDSVDTGVFGGIGIGMISAILFNRYYHLELPSYLGFFSGKRSVPIITAGVAVIFGMILSVCWPPIGNGIQAFSQWTLHGNPKVAFAIYGFVERMLIPFGLHHIWNVPFQIQVGSFVDASGHVLHGEIPRYIAGDPTAGNLAGGYLFKMWGLPAAALAMWRMAKPENRSKVAGIMISAALTSFVTGITEPIEFSFMFVAPFLYLVHAILSAAGFSLCILLGIKHGTTFSHGLIDFVILYPQSHRALWFFVIGPAWALLYYGIFCFAISKFDLKTPGREDDVMETEEVPVEGNDIAGELVVAFGGAANIRSLDSCITRLRVQVEDQTKVNKERLKALGATAVLNVADGVQAIFGTRSENLKTDMDRYMRQTGSAPSGTVARTVRNTRAAVSAANRESQATIGSLNVPELVRALGGKENVLSANNVALTRVRVEVRDSKLINTDAINRAGVGTQQIKDGLYHLVIGDQAPNIAAQLMEV